jgi:hypothetical protein
MKEMNSVGARRVVEMLLGEDQAARWTLLVVRDWGFLFLSFVFLAIWLPSKATPVGSQVLLWILTYTIYL